jgi:hypothetical protein
MELKEYFTSLWYKWLWLIRQTRQNAKGQRKRGLRKQNNDRKWLSWAKSNKKGHRKIKMKAMDPLNKNFLRKYLKEPSDYESFNLALGMSTLRVSDKS